MTVRVEKDGPVTTIINNRPEARNAVDPETGDALVEAFDTDGDHRVSRAEFVEGPTPGFDLADANHDGLVSKAEASAMRDAARARARARG